MQLLPVTILPGLLDMSVQAGTSRQHFSEQIIGNAPVTAHDVRYISLQQLDELLSRVYAEATDAAVGLTLGSANKPHNIGLLGLLMTSAPSLRHCIECLLKFKDLLVPYLFFELHETDVLARLRVWSDASLAFARSRIHNDVVVASLVAVARVLTDNGLGLLSVAFRHPLPANIEDYERFFDSSLRFSSPANELAFRRADLDAPLPGARPEHHWRVCRYAQWRLHQLQLAQGVAGQVRRRLEGCLSDKQLSSIEAVAEVLAMTPRTLQRRLNQEGVTFAKVRDRLRHQQACFALRQADCDISVLASQLGFSEIANFYHAFRRWQGVSPGHFRRHQAMK